MHSTACRRRVTRCSKVENVLLSFAPTAPSTYRHSLLDRETNNCEKLVVLPSLCLSYSILLQMQTVCRNVVSSKIQQHGDKYYLCHYRSPFLFRIAQAATPCPLPRRLCVPRPLDASAASNQRRRHPILSKLISYSFRGTLPSASSSTSCFTVDRCVAPASSSDMSSGGSTCLAVLFLASSSSFANRDTLCGSKEAGYDESQQVLFDPKSGNSPCASQ